MQTPCRIFCGGYPAARQKRISGPRTPRSPSGRRVSARCRLNRATTKPSSALASNERPEREPVPLSLERDFGRVRPLRPGTNRCAARSPALGGMPGRRVTERPASGFETWVCFKTWRPRPELNRGKRFCRPLRNHSATWPLGRFRQDEPPAPERQSIKEARVSDNGTDRHVTPEIPLCFGVLSRRGLPKTTPLPFPARSRTRLSANLEANGCSTPRLRAD